MLGRFTLYYAALESCKRSWRAVRGHEELVAMIQLTVSLSANFASRDVAQRRVVRHWIVTRCSSVDIVTRLWTGRPKGGKSIAGWPPRPGVPMISHRHKHIPGHPIHMNHKSSTHPWTLVHITAINLHPQGDVNTEGYKINTYLCIMCPWGSDLSLKHVGSSMCVCVCVDDLWFYIDCVLGLVYVQGYSQNARNE